MKVLFVVPYVPSLVRARSFNLIRALTARGHGVTVATAWSTDAERKDAETLSHECGGIRTVHLPAWRSMMNAVRALPTGEPLQSAYSWSERLLAEAARLAAHADVIHVEHLRGVRYALRLRALDAAPVVWDSVDCIAHLFEQAARARPDLPGRIVNRFELSRTARYEAWLWRVFDRTLVTSPIDREAMLGLDRSSPSTGAIPDRASGGEERLRVVPNGVDADYFTPSRDAREPQTLVFSGKMSYHANVATARHLVTAIMPRVWSRRPGVRLVIVGSHPPRAITELARSNAARVIVTGTVPDVRPYLRSASIAVVPLVYGAGSQFKVLEAMACGTPVVASTRAVGALTAVPGRDLLVADDPADFARLVCDLLDSPARQREIGEAGRAYVERHHRWDRIAARLEALYDEILIERRARTAPHSTPAVA